MKTLHILFFLFILTALGAQEAGTNHLITYFNINVYTGTVETTLPDGEEPIETRERTSFTLGNFTPAMGFYHLNDNFSEIELTNLFFGSEDKINLIDGNDRDIAGTTSRFGVGIRYEYNLSLIKRESMKFYVAGSINPTIISKKLKPESDYLYTTSMRSFTLPLAIAPKAIYYLGESLFFTYSLPITLLEIGSSSINYSSSVIPGGGSKSANSFFSFLPARTHVRLGIGARF